MWLLDKCYAIDAWLLKEKFQKWSDSIFDRYGVSRIRQAQLCVAISCGSSYEAYVNCPDPVFAQLDIMLVAVTASVVVIMELLAFIQRMIGPEKAVTSMGISQRMRVAYVVLMFLVTGTTLLLTNLPDRPENSPRENAFVTLALISMVAFLYFVSCEWRPRKPRTVTITALKKA